MRIVGRWVLKHRGASRVLHHVIHRRGSYVACFLCRAVWAYIDTMPGLLPTPTEALFP